MQTTDTSFAAWLMRCGYELSQPVDYSLPNWQYTFDLDPDEWHLHLSFFRRNGLADFLKIHQALNNIGKGRTVHAVVLGDWLEVAGFRFGSQENVAFP